MTALSCFLIPFKASESLGFFWCFEGVRRSSTAWLGLFLVVGGFGWSRGEGGGLMGQGKEIGESKTRLSSLMLYFSKGPGHQALSTPNFDIFLILPSFLDIKSRFTWRKKMQKWHVAWNLKETIPKVSINFKWIRFWSYLKKANNILCKEYVFWKLSKFCAVQKERN